MSNIKINHCVYKVHPVYNLYASDENGNIIHLVRQVPSPGQKHKSGYLVCMVRKHGQNGQKNYFVHRFVYECFNGIIPDDKVVDHVNNIKDDNRLCNLQLMTYYNSMYAVNQYLGINAGIVKMVCEKINDCKTGISKIDNHSYKFEYVNKQDMPDNYIKSANRRSNRVPDEDKKKHQKEAMKRWQQKEYECPKCGKIYKNSYRFVHKKKCK